jgi:hypothetical protein
MLRSILSFYLSFLRTTTQVRLENLFLRKQLEVINTQRTHLGICYDSPEPREVQGDGEIDKVAVVNGLHHYHFRHAA